MQSIHITPSGERIRICYDDDGMTVNGKRVVAPPGARLSIVNGRVSINGVPWSGHDDAVAAGAAAAAPAAAAPAAAEPEAKTAQKATKSKKLKPKPKSSSGRRGDVVIGLVSVSQGATMTFQRVETERPKRKSESKSKSKSE